jgi:hypothetical protein
MKKKRDSGSTSNTTTTAITWADLEFIIPARPSSPARLVLRHSKRLQYGYTPAADETLGAALRKMEMYCKAHTDGNPKITGAVKVVEHTKIDNVPLRAKLALWCRKQNV